MKRFLGALIYLSLIVIGLTLPATSANSTGQVLSAFTTATNVPDVNVIFDQINTQRKQVGAPELTRSEVLTEIAAKRAEDMANNKYYAHKSPSGLYYFDLLPEEMENNYSCENLNLQFTKRSDHYVQEWLNSPSHKKCMLNKSVKKAGFAAVQYTDATNGHESYIVVAIHAE